MWIVKRKNFKLKTLCQIASKLYLFLLWDESEI